MTSSDDSPRDPVDPDFAGLFRPEPDPEPAGEPAAPSSTLFESGPLIAAVDLPDDAVVHVEEVDEAEPAEVVDEVVVVEPEAPAVPVADPIADTGRIFRSQGVTGHDDAVLAIGNDRRLRTLERRSDYEPVEVVVPVVAGASAAGDAASVHQVIPAPADHAPGEVPVADVPRSRIHRSRSITAGAVYIVVIGVTVVVGFLNAWLSSGDLGWPTGLALLASSVYAALTVRREDDTAAIIIPPVAFLIAALTAGQVFVGALEGSLLNRVVVVFFTLAANWVWIIGATVAALAIVLVRRRRG